MATTIEKTPLGTLFWTCAKAVMKCVQRVVCIFVERHRLVKLLVGLQVSILLVLMATRTKTKQPKDKVEEAGVIRPKFVIKRRASAEQIIKMVGGGEVYLKKLQSESKNNSRRKQS